MAFKLIIEFHGLCLFVPDEQNQVMHVLLPESGHMPHDAFFQFEPVHDANGDLARSSEPFNGLRWNLANLVNTGVGNLHIPAEVLDIGACVGKQGIPRSQVMPGMQTNVKSHIMLTGGEVLCRGKAPRFNIGSQRGVPAASMLRWTLDVPGAALDWEFETLAGSPAPRPVPLVPVNGEIRLFLFHAPANEGATAQICLPAAANHAPMYYPLLNGTGAAPACRGTKDYVPGTCVDAAGLAPASGDDSLPADGVSPAASEAARAARAWQASGAASLAPNVFTCMLGQATII